MAISNTSILIKRSLTTGKPTSLNAGEFAYSYASNTLFIGTPGGTGVVNVGGQYYTSTLDAATSSNVASTLVKRDSSGGFTGQLYGNANTSSTLQNAQNFSISGGDITASTQSFKGDGPVVLNASLNTISGLSAGTYGSTTSIPVVTVAANGRVTSISTAGLSTTITVSGNTGSSTLYTGNTLTIQGGSSGIVTSESASGGGATVTISTDSTVARTNTTSVGPQTFLTDVNLPTNNMSVGGTLTVTNVVISGNVTQYNANTLSINDPIIYLANNNSGNAVDIGMVGHFIGQGHTGSYSGYQHTGFVRDFNDNKWKLFSNVIVEPTTTVTFDANTFYDTIKVGGVDVSSGDVTSANAVITSYLSTGRANTTGDIGVGGNIYANNIVGLTANVKTINVLSGMVSTGSYVGPYIDGSIFDYTDGTGRITVGTADGFAVYNNGTAHNLLFSINSSGQINTAVWQASTIGIAYGGTNNTSFTNGQLTYFDGTKIASLANTGTTGTYGSSSYIPILTTDAYGRVSSVSNTAISIDTSQVTSGTLPISRGGTNNNGTYTSGAILQYNGTSVVSLPNTTFTATGSGSTNNTITSVTVDAYGRFTAATYSAISGLTVPQGGTGLSTATTNGIVFGNGTGAFGVTALAGSGSDQTWSNQILTVTNAGVPVWASAMDGGTF